MSQLLILCDLVAKKKERGFARLYIQSRDIIQEGEYMWIYQDGRNYFETYNPSTLYKAKDEAKELSERLIRKVRRFTQVSGVDTYIIPEEIIDREYVKELVKRVHEITIKASKEGETEELKSFIQSLKRAKPEELQGEYCMIKYADGVNLSKDIKKNLINHIAIMNEKIRQYFFMRLR